MKLLDWQKVINNRYNHLLVVQVSLLVLYPILARLETKIPVATLIFLLALAPALHVVLSRKHFLILMSIGVMAFLLEWVEPIWMPSRGKASGDVRYITASILTLYAIFFMFTIVILARRIATRTIITGDTVKGGISVYLLIGFLWAVFYRIMLMFDPGAFSNMEFAGTDCTYFSLVTLTTLGYGDITPVTNYAKFLSVLEAFVGQIYIAIFIAQLIGLKIAKRIREEMIIDSEK